MKRLINISVAVDTENTNKFTDDLLKQIGITIGTFIDDYHGTIEVRWKSDENGHNLSIDESYGNN